MRVLSKNDVNKQVISEIVRGAVFIYPTDTIYGVGCDATSHNSVKRIRELKGREKKPFSVIAPSVQWIRENCDLNEVAKSWLLKLPGPYTLLLPLKNSDAVCAQTNMGLNTIGVRIPDHWISDLVEKVGKPIITTSVNLSGNPPSTNIDQLEQFSVDFIIFEGEKLSSPSKIIDTTGKIVQR